MSRNNNNGNNNGSNNNNNGSNNNNGDERTADYDGLMDAVKAKDIEDVARILAENPEVFEEEGASKLLEKAIETDSFDLVKLLGDAGADVNEASKKKGGPKRMLDVAIKTRAQRLRP